MTGGRRTALPRQQTLQALIDWSWNLLDDKERTLLRRLFVFSGGWIGFLIILLLIGLSVGGLALAVEQVLTLRQDVLMPPGLGDDVARGLAARDVPAADQACQAKPSVLAFVLRAVRDGSFDDLEGPAQRHILDDDSDPERESWSE